MEEERLQALASERQKEEEKLREEIRIKDIVQEQMYELKEREHEVIYVFYAIFFFFSYLKTRGQHFFINRPQSTKYISSTQKEIIGTVQ